MIAKLLSDCILLPVNKKLFFIDFLWNPRKEVPSYGADLWRLGLLFFLCYLLFMGSHGLIDPDEGRYNSVSVEMLMSGHGWVPHVNGAVFLDKPILFYWLQLLAMWVFGINDWSMRLFPVLSGVLAGLALYGCGRCVWNRRVGIFASLIWISSPLVFGISHFSNMDMEVAAWITCSISLLYCALHVEPYPQQETERPKRLGVRGSLMLGAYGCAALAFLTKGLIGIVFPAMVLLLWSLWRKQWRVWPSLKIFWGVLLIIVMVAPWFWVVQSKEPWFFHYFFIYQQVDRFVGQNFNQQQPIWFYPGLMIAGMLPWSIWLGMAVYRYFKSPEKKMPLRISSQSKFVWIWLMSILIFFSIPASKLPGYIAPALAPAALLIAIYLDQCQSLRCSAQKLWKIVLGSTLGALMLGWIGLALLSKLPVNTLNPLLHKIQRCAPKHARVASYQAYYQALPIVYRHPVYVVADWHDTQQILANDDWRRMLYLGTLKPQDAAGRKWLLSTAEFQHEWSQSAWIVYLPENAVSGFLHDYPESNLCGKYNGIAVIKRVNP